MSLNSKNTAADASRNINRAYGNNTVCKRAVQRWYQKLNSGMNLSKTMDKWVSHELSEKNKFDHLSACSAHVIRHKNVSFLDQF